MLVNGRTNWTEKGFVHWLLKRDLPILILNQPPMLLRAVNDIIFLIILQCQLLWVLGFIVIYGYDHGFPGV